MSFNPKVIIIIRMLSIIFIKNNVSVVKGINKTKIVKLPVSAPRVILSKLAFLFSTSEITSSNIKSKAKLRNSTRSKYIFIFITFLSIEKKRLLFCRFVGQNFNFFACAFPYVMSISPSSFSLLNCALRNSVNISWSESSTILATFFSICKGSF